MTLLTVSELNMLLIGFVMVCLFFEFRVLAWDLFEIFLEGRFDVLRYQE